MPDGTSTAETIRTNGHAPVGGSGRRRPRRFVAANLAARAALVLLIAAFAAGIVVFAVFNPRSRPGLSTAGYSTTVERFVLPRLNEPGTLRLVDLRGRPVVVGFFATWCPQCPAQLQTMTQEAVEKHGRIGFVAVDTRETGNGAAFAKQQRLPPVISLARDVGGVEADGLYESLGGTGIMPLTAFYNSDGKLLATQVGLLNSRDMSARLLQLFGVAAGRTTAAVTETVWACPVSSAVSLPAVPTAFREAISTIDPSPLRTGCR